MNLLTVLMQHSRQITHTGSTQDLKSEAPTYGLSILHQPNTKHRAHGCSAKHKPLPPPRTFGKTREDSLPRMCRARRALAPSVPVAWGHMPPPSSQPYPPPTEWAVGQPTARSCTPSGGRTSETEVRRPRSRDRALRGEPPTGTVPKPPANLARAELGTTLRAFSTPRPLPGSTQGGGVIRHLLGQAPGIFVGFPEVPLERVRHPPAPPLDNIDGYPCVQQGGRAADPQGMRAVPIRREALRLGCDLEEGAYLGRQDRGPVGPPEQGL